MSTATNQQLSPHFTAKEFACSHCNRSFVDPTLVAGLEKLRVAAGRATHILSGYRCVTHNKKIGGASTSMHIAGRAADIQVDQLTAKQVLDIALTIPEFTGVGFYPEEHFVHVDTRPQVKGAPKATWARVGNKYVSLEQGVKKWDSLKIKI